MGLLRFKAHGLSHRDRGPKNNWAITPGSALHSFGAPACTWAIMYNTRSSREETPFTEFVHVCMACVPRQMPRPLFPLHAATQGDP